MRTRSKSYPNNSNATIPRRQNKRRVPNIVEPEIHTIKEVVPMADQTMEELLQAPTEGYGEAIVILEILVKNFEIKTNLLQLAQTNKFHGFEKDNPHTHISNFKRMTSTLKYRDVPNDAIKLMLFPYSLEGAARIWYEKEPPNSILTWDDLAWERFKEMLRACPHHGFLELTQIDTFYNGLNEQDQDSLNATAGGNLLSKTTREALKIIKNKSKVRYSRSKLNVSRMNTNSRESSSKTDDRIDKLADQISNLVEIVNKQVITPASVKAVVKTYVICGGAHAYYDFIATDSNQSSVCASTGTLSSNTIPNPKGEMKVVTTRRGLAYEGPSILTNSPLENVVERETEETTDKEQPNCQGSTTHIQPPVVPTLIPEPDVPKNQPKPNIPYPSRLNDQKLHKLFELAKVPLNENCSAILLKKLLEKLGDPGKFLIPCDFLGIDVCHALDDLGASINIMPLSICKKLSLPELTPTRMTLELADRFITRPKGVSEDVFVKVGKFYFPTDFVVVDFDSDPRVRLILGRSFLRTGRALIDVYGEEITLRVNDESVTFNLNQTMRYSSTYDDNSENRVDVIDIAYEEFAQDMLDFQYNSKSSNPTLVSNPLFSEDTKSEFCKEPIVKSSLPTLTPFGESDFFLEEIEDFLKDESIPTGIEDSFYDPKGDILYLKKRAVAWKISDIKSIDPRFCTHKFLIGEDYKPAVQSQRRVNPKINDVIKKEVIKPLDAGMIYPISDILWVSPIHCVPKMGSMTVVANENNELIPTRLVTGWRVCIDYRKLNDATRKDHFPLPFTDQMLERLAGNEFYCFLDGFSGYFQIPIDPQDQEKTTFTCPYGTFAYLRMPFGLCNAPGHKISKSGIKVDSAKVDVIAKLPHPTTVKGVRIFLGHASFYRRFIQDFSKIARPMTHLLEKETPFVFSKDCIDAFETLKKKLNEAPILVVLYWNLPYELMCDAIDFAIVYAFEKFRPYLVLSKSIVYTDHSALKYLLSKEDAKLRLLRWVLLLQEFDITIRDKKGSENLAADHLSRLENPHKDVLENKDINENFPLETLGSLSSGSTPWNKYILVAVDYLSKWVEAKTLPTNDARVVVKFLKSLFSRFGTLRAIISDRGTHCCNDQFARVMTKYEVTHRLATAYHPQKSGQVEVSNGGLKRIL
nr:hypothetical protein [Tanacetum cinerariifolium]